MLQDSLWVFHLESFSPTTETLQASSHDLTLHPLLYVSAINWGMGLGCALSQVMRRWRYRSFGGGCWVSCNSDMVALQRQQGKTLIERPHTWLLWQPALQSRCSPYFWGLLPSAFIGLFIICTAATLQLKVDYLWAPSGTGGESRHLEMQVLPLAAFSTLPPPLTLSSYLLFPLLLDFPS